MMCPPPCLDRECSLRRVIETDCEGGSVVRPRNVSQTAARSLERASAWQAGDGMV